VRCCAVLVTTCRLSRRSRADRGLGVVSLGLDGKRLAISWSASRGQTVPNVGEIAWLVGVVEGKGKGSLMDGGQTG
jgi:hypothetical protein